jgi:ABC-type uncharacterized transport system auxiliary subunit
VIRRRFQLITILTVVASFVAACGAPRPVKYYVVDIPPTPAPASVTPFPVSLLVGRFTASHLYQDDRLVYGSGQVQLGTYEYDRWAENPADMVRDALIMTLRNSGQYAAVSRVAASVRGNYILRGHLLQMYGVDQPALMARFSLQLELYDPSTRTIVWSQLYSHDEPVPDKTVPSIVLAMDKNIAAGMQQLTASLAQYFASHPPAAAGN